MNQAGKYPDCDNCHYKMAYDKEVEGVQKITTHNTQRVPCENCNDGKFLRHGETCLVCGRQFGQV